MQKIFTLFETLISNITTLYNKKIDVLKLLVETNQNSNPVTSIYNEFIAEILITDLDVRKELLQRLQLISNLDNKIFALLEKKIYPYNFIILDKIADLMYNLHQQSDKKLLIKKLQKFIKNNNILSNLSDHDKKEILQWIDQLFQKFILIYPFFEKHIIDIGFKISLLSNDHKAKLLISIIQFKQILDNYSLDEILFLLIWTNELSPHNIKLLQLRNDLNTKLTILQQTMVEDFSGFVDFADIINDNCSILAKILPNIQHNLDSNVFMELNVIEQNIILDINKVLIGFTKPATLYIFVQFFQVLSINDIMKIIVSTFITDKKFHIHNTISDINLNIKDMITNIQESIMFLAALICNDIIEKYYNKLKNLAHPFYNHLNISFDELLQVVHNYKILQNTKLQEKLIALSLIIDKQKKFLLSSNRYMNQKHVFKNLILR